MINPRLFKGDVKDISDINTDVLKVKKGLV